MEAPPELPHRKLEAHPIVTTTLITVLAGILLQMSNIIGFQDIVASVVSDNFVTVRLIDIGFRMTMGALLVFVAIPLVLSYLHRGGWRGGYATLLPTSMGPSPQGTTAAAGLSALAFFSVLVAFAIVAGVFEGNTSVLISDDNWLILLAALVPGVWEELTFRGVVQSILRRHFPPLVAVAISSVAFGLMHFSNYLNWDDSSSVVAGVIAATTLGFAWGYLVLETGSILPAIVLHYLVDVVLFDELFIDPLATDDATSIVYVAIVFLYPILTVLATKTLFRPTVARAG